MRYVIAYGAILAAFCIIDGIWLSVMGPKLYRPTLGNILLPSVNFAPAIVFYLLYPAGVLVFAVMPALGLASALTALMHGALLGAIAYATYDLTNQATLRNWSVTLSVIDIGWGSFATAASAAAAYAATRAIGW